MKYNADLTQPASCNIHDLAWEATASPGVHRRRLEQDDDHAPVERVTTVVRFAAGSAFHSHTHAGGEEFLVLDGVFSDQYGDFPAGYYVRNPKGTAHAPHTDQGCTLWVKLWQMQPDDQQSVAIDTNDASLWQPNADGSHQLILFDADYESVRMLRWQAGYELARTFSGGVEYYVLQGQFHDNDATYTAGSWLRLPTGSQQTLCVDADCVVLRKTGHLRHPVTYV